MNPGVLLLIRLPVYGICDSGRGFWKRLDGDAKAVGFNASRVYPAFYYLNATAEGGKYKTVAVLTTHVDDLLFAYLPEGKQFIDDLLGRFDIGPRETDNFRYCGKQISTDETGISIDVIDNTLRIKPVRIEPGRANSDPLNPGETSQLRSVVGSLAWVAGQGRPDLLYSISRLQSEVSNATIMTLKDANKAVDLAIAGTEKGYEVKMKYPFELFRWEECGVLSVSDASFTNEPGMKSQQGRCHFLCPWKELKNVGQTKFHVLPVSFSSTTIKRVCRATLQAEAYSMQASQETGDRIRALLVEMLGEIPENMKGWEQISREKKPQLNMSDCLSLVSHLNAEILTKCQDRRLEVEMRAIRQSLRDEIDDQLTSVKYPAGGDHLIWIHTSTVIADCLTKRMKPDLLLRVLQTNEYCVQITPSPKKKKEQGG